MSTLTVRFYGIYGKFSQTYDSLKFLPYLELSIPCYDKIQLEEK